MGRILSEGKHWPQDYVKTALNTVFNSSLGKSSWYSDSDIRNDLKKFVDAFDPLAHKNSNLGYFAVIIKWFVEYSTDEDKKDEFIDSKLNNIVKTLLYISKNPSEESRLKEQIKTKWTFDDFEKYQKEKEEQIKADQEEKLKNASSDDKGYEVIAIDSYEELHEFFGGDKTGYQGRSEWCHTNGENTYDHWTQDGAYMFFVIMKKNWEDIEPPDPETTNAYDEYGTSLIAVLIDVASKELEKSTLRWNHIIEPSDTRPGRGVDTAFAGLGDLVETTGKGIIDAIEKQYKKMQASIEYDKAHADEKIKKILEKNDKDRIDKWDIPNHLRNFVSHLEIPNNITKIGFEAFRGCKNLKSVVIPDSVGELNYAAFEDCPELTSVAFSKNTKEINGSVFSDCASLKSIELPEGVERIGRFAFYNSGLTDIHFPKSLKSIEDSAFGKCENLTAVYMPDIETYFNISYNQFGNPVTSRKAFNAGDTKLFVGEKEFDFINPVIPEGIEEIGSGALKNFQKMKTIKLPSTLKKLGDYSFWGAYELEDIEIPPSVEEIGDCAFRYLSWMRKITIPGTVKKIGNECFSRSYFRTIIIEDGVEEAGKKCFENGRFLKEIQIPDSLHFYPSCLEDNEELEVVYCSDKKWDEIKEFVPEKTKHLLKREEKPKEKLQSRYYSNDVALMPESKLNTSDIWYFGNNRAEDFVLVPPTWIFPFYLTKSQEYAEKYADYGVYKVTIKDDLNILDFSSTEDLKKLKVPDILKEVFKKSSSDLNNYCHELYNLVFGAKNSNYKFLYLDKPRMDDWKKCAETLAAKLFKKSDFNKEFNDSMPKIKERLSETFSDELFLIYIYYLMHKAGFDGFKRKEFNNEVIGIFNFNSLDKISVNPVSALPTKESLEIDYSDIYKKFC